MAYTDQQREFYQKAKAAGWDDAKIRSGITRLGERTPGGVPQAFASAAPNPDMLGDFARGATGAVKGLGIGAQQIWADVTGDEKQQAALRAVALEHKNNAPDTTPGKIGSFATNAALALPGLIAAPEATIPMILAGAAEGGTLAALAPTTAPGERTSNVKWGAGLGGALPAAGATLRSGPFSKATDFMADWNPFTYKSRLTAKNDAIKEATALEKALIKRQNMLAKNEHSALAEDAGRTHTAAVDAEARRVAELNAQAARQEAARVAQVNANREADLDLARKQVAKNAGWDAVPENRQQVEDALAAVGVRYGKAIKSVRMNSAPVVTAIEKASEVGGLSNQQSRLLAGIGQRLRMASTKAGVVKGEHYKTLRSELTGELMDARGAYREQVLKSIKALDSSFKDAVADPKAYKEMVRLRQQYSLGSKLRTMSFDPSAPMDVFKMQRHLDARGNDATGTREFLTDVVSRVPKKPAKANKLPQIEPNAVPGPVPVGPPPTPAPMPVSKLEGGDPWKMGAINLGVGAATGGSHLAVAPTMYALRSAANNDYIRKPLAAALKAFTQQTIQE